MSVGGCGGLKRDSVGKADLLSHHFDTKQSREHDDLPLTCHPSSVVLLYIDFRSSDQFGMFLLFSSKAAVDCVD